MRTPGTGCNKTTQTAATELLSRTTLETHKLDLMAEISALKLRLATSEKSRVEAEEARRSMEEKLKEAQKRCDELQSRLNDKTIEVNELRSRVPRNGTIPLLNDSGMNTTDSNRSLDRTSSTFDKEKTLDRLKRKHTEVERLKKVVESLMTTNNEKDCHIDELGRLLKKYRRLEDMMVGSGGRKALDGLNLEDDQSDSSSRGDSASSSEHQPDHQYVDRLSGEYGENHNLVSQHTSTPVSHNVEGKPPLPHLKSPAPSVISTLSFTPKNGDNGRSNSVDDLSPAPGKTPPTVRRGHGYAAVDEEALKDEMARQYKALQNGNQNGGTSGHLHREEVTRKSKHRGIKKLFGKLRRSTSQDMDGGDLESFKRNGLRATAGPRLGWSKDVPESEIPFSRWDSDRVATWLHGLGLSMYVGECKRWVKNGQHLSTASQSEVEKEFCMRNQFHRKKLHLALQAVIINTSDPLNDLDHQWVTRWLDDIGLPQYKDFFLEARIDGRMLHYLTVDELVALRITNNLHHLSIRRAIQVLRENNFNPGILKRRPSHNETNFSNVPGEVSLWTNHRVMDWLRTIDLSEYAPNLRGSGVHGGLMVYEPRFGAELFASILSIPASKTLLRRHLSTHFVTLIGNDVQHGKRDLEQVPGYTPLTPNQKVKLKKFGLFGGPKRGRTVSESDDFVCPLKNGASSADESHNNGYLTPSYGTSRDNSLTRQQSLPRQPSSPYTTTTEKKTVHEMGNVSQEINTLTHLLSRDKFFEDVPSSNV